MALRRLKTTVQCGFRQLWTGPRVAGSAYDSRWKQAAWFGGGILIYGATAALACSILDDVLIYRTCTSKAMEMVAEDPRMKSMLGESFKQGSWYEASLGTTHHKKAVSCTFPVYGDQGSLGSVRLKAVREGDSISSLAYNIIGPAQWDLLILEATVQSADNQTSQRINLIEPTNATQPVVKEGGPKASDPHPRNDYVRKLLAKHSS